MTIMQTGIGPPLEPEVDDPAPTEPALPGEEWALPLLHATGALLVLLVPLHVVGLLLDPGQMSEVSLLRRWENPGWLLADWALLVIGVFHALVALWLRVRRSALSPSRQTAVFAGIGGASVALLLLASWSMLFLV